MSDRLIVGISVLLLLTGCEYTMVINFTTPAERAALSYIHCANYWRIHPEQEQDMKDLSAAIGCPTDQGSHCLCADWEGMQRKEFEDNAKDGL